MYGQVKTAHYFLETGFSDLFPNSNGYSDNGHIPLYPLYLACLFKFFGLKLWVAHLSVWPFLLGLIYQLKKISSRFLSPVAAAVVQALLFFTPAFVTQNLYFSAEIAFVFAALWLLNSVLEGHSSHIFISSVFLSLLNLRGISVCVTLLFYFVYVRKEKRAWLIFAGMIGWGVGVWVHYRITGWLFAGDQVKEFREVTTATGFLKNMLISVWKLLDLGALFGWVAVIGIAIRTRKITTSLSLLFVLTLSVMAVCWPTTNPISNRYFLLTYVLLLPAFVEAVQVLPVRRAMLISAAFALVLFSNNGVTYPERYGNAWDCSLKSYSYFGLRQQLDDFVHHHQIDPRRVAAGFQLYFNDRYYKMNNTDREYALLSDTELPSADFVAESNICNNYNEQRQWFLEERYELLREFNSGAVYIHLYRKKIRP